MNKQDTTVPIRSAFARAYMNHQALFELTGAFVAGMIGAIPMVYLEFREQLEQVEQTALGLGQLWTAFEDEPRGFALVCFRWIIAGMFAYDGAAMLVHSFMSGRRSGSVSPGKQGALNQANGDEQCI